VSYLCQPGNTPAEHDAQIEKLRAAAVTSVQFAARILTEVELAAFRAAVAAMEAKNKQEKGGQS
jgi:hypothetical protein